MKTILLAICTTVSVVACGNPLEEMYQRDMDRVRIKHVDYLASLTFDFSVKTGRAPLADRLEGKAIEVFVTHRQIDPAILEQAAKLPIVLMSTDDLKADLEKGLGRTINLPSDPQNVATFAPNLYIYHVDDTQACVAGHLYREAPGARRVGNYYKYQSCTVLNNGLDHPLTAEERRYQRDADIFRARHLVEWAEIIEAYYEKTAHYPLQHRTEGDKIVLVQIATRQQQNYLDPKSPSYVKKIDIKGPRFTLVSVKDFVAEIERVLQREIDERYDPQSVPNGAAPLYLSYFADKNGYLIWTACQTCPMTSNSFSTLLTGGMPTINIGSNWFVKNIGKTQSIASLQANKEFVDFVGNGPTRPELFEQLERAQVHESKK
jgi:hypothetical protein